MVTSRFRVSPFRELSALLVGALFVINGCSDGDGGKGGTGGSAIDGGPGGTGGSTPRLDGGTDTPVATGGKDAGTGGAKIDTGVDAPASTDLGNPLDVAAKPDVAEGSDALPDGGNADGPLATTLHLYVGCADQSGSIQVYTLNSVTGAMAPLTTFLAGGAISNVEFNAAEDRAYIAHVINGESKISTYSRNKSTGALTLLGTPVAAPFYPNGAPDGGVDAAPSTNAGPQTLTFDRGGRFLAVPNYFNGYTYVYDLATDGSLKSIVAKHTAGNNAHHAVFTLNNKFVLVPYLGSNLI